MEFLVLCPKSLRLFGTQNKVSHRKIETQKINMKGAEVPTPVHKGIVSASEAASGHPGLPSPGKMPC